MLDTVVDAAVRRRATVLGGALLAMVSAWIALAGAKFDSFPEFTRPRVTVRTAAPGFPPEEVEASITRPIEEGLSGTPDLQSVHSQSSPGQSVVTAVFREGADLTAARERVNERLAGIATGLPAGAESPVLAPVTSSTSALLAVGLTAERRSLMDVRTLADGTVRPRLLSVPGIASVLACGGEVRQVQVQIQPEAMARHGLSADQVVDSVRRTSGHPGTGFIETANQRVPVRLEGQPASAADLGECLAAPGIRLKDVAEVIEAPEANTTGVAINGKPGVLLFAWGQNGENTLVLTRALASVLEEMRPFLEREGIEIHADLLRLTGDLEASLRSLRLSLLVGGALMGLGLAFFSSSLRAAFVSLFAILLSLLMAAAVLAVSRVTFNALTLGGLVLAIGEVVSDAVLTVENIRRRLRENHQTGPARSVLDVVRDSAVEVRGLILPGALLGALVFIPALVLAGVAGKLLAPLGLAYLLAVLASLVVSLTVTPALSAILLGGNAAAEPGHRRRLASAYQHLLGASLRRPGVVTVFAALLCVLSALGILSFSGGFLPGARNGHLLVQMSMAPGTSATETMRLGREVGQQLGKHPLIRSVALRVGHGEPADDAGVGEVAELILGLRSSGPEAEEALAGVRGLLAGVPGIRFAVTPLGKRRLDEAFSVPSDVVKVRLHGDDLDVLDSVAGDLEGVLKSVPGSAALRSAPGRVPHVVARLRPEKLRHLGFRPGDLMDTIRTGFLGTVASQVHGQNGVVAVVVILDDPYRQDPEAIGSLMVQGPSGAGVPLRELADVFLSTGRAAVLREGLRRYVEVSCRVEGRDLHSFVREAEATIRGKMRFPPDVKLAFAGAAAGRALPPPEALSGCVLAGGAIVLLIALALGRPRSVVLVLAVLPFALAGGALAILLAGGKVSPGSLVGFVGIFGITIRHALIVFKTVERLETPAGRPMDLETLRRAPAELFPSFLGIAAAVGLTLLPLAIRGVEPGAEIAAPMAAVLVGGLLTSTVLLGLVLPSLALRHGAFGDRVR